MKVGHARLCISPKKEFYLIGYRSENRNYPANGIHDDIYCNSLLFEDEGREVFLFSADVLEFEEDMAEDVKTMLQTEFGIERDMVLLVATHNHSSIVSYHKGWYTGHFDQEYYNFFLETIKESYRIAKSNKQEATAQYGKQVIIGYYGNRNHPGELADNEVIVVNFLDKDNHAFAGFVNWAVHSTVISAENTYLTSELAGEVSKKLYDEFGYYPAMIVGAAGDCSNRNERQGNDFNELERVSTLLVKDIATIVVDQPVQLGKIKYQTLFHTIHHHMEFVHEEIKEEIEKYKKVLKTEQDVNKKKFLETKIKNLSLELDIVEFHLDAKGSVINIGQIQLFVFPGELGSQFGKELKQSTTSLGIVCGYTNGYYEYFMPKEEYGLSFETIGCRVPKGEPEKLIQKYIQASKCMNRED